MRIEFHVFGKGTGAMASFAIDMIPPFPFGRDNNFTKAFAYSLANYARATILKCNKEGTEKGLLKKKTADSLIDHITGGNYAKIYIDIWVECRKGKQLYFCKVSNSENGCSLRTRNLLPLFTRYLFGLAKMTKNGNGPKQLECLRHINIIKCYEENQFSLDSIEITDKEVKFNQNLP